MDSVENACVLFDAVNKRIHAFVQTRTPMNMHKLRSYLLDRVPKYAFPSRLVVMEALPLNPNGKIARTRLKEMMKDG